jgi:hypothetical protein
MSPGLAAMTATAGAAVPFARAAGLLEDLAGIRVTVKRVERAAEASGTALAAASRGQARLIARRKLVPLPPDPAPDKLYAVIDGTGVPMTSRETEGRDGKGEDGRARTREVKMAVFFTQDMLDDDGYPVRDRASSSYLATFDPAAAFGDLVKAEGIRRGAGHARQMTIIGDGAAWIWGIATRVFPEATQIVDLYHAREHLHSLTRSLEFMLLDRKDEWLAARLEDLDYGHIDGIAAAVRKYPWRASRKTRSAKSSATSSTTPPACATTGSASAAYSSAPASSKPAARQSSASASSNPACTGPSRSRLHHHPALRRGQQPVGSHLPRPPQPDRRRLTRWPARPGVRPGEQRGPVTAGPWSQQGGQPAAGDIALRGLELPYRRQSRWRRLERARGEVAGQRADHRRERLPADVPPDAGPGQQLSWPGAALHCHAGREAHQLNERGAAAGMRPVHDHHPVTGDCLTSEQ